MIKQLLIILIIFTAITSTVAQITIDAADMPKISDTLRMSQAVNIPGDYKKTGPNMTWDFSMLTRSGQQVVTFVSPTSAPPLYQYFFTPGLVADLAVPGTNLQAFPGLPFTDFFTFFRKTPSIYADAGFAFSLSGIPVPLKYDQPDIHYTFPCTAGSTWSSASVAAISMPGLAYFGTSRNRTSVVDGWGQLTTPFGTFETIRVKSEIVEYDSLYADTLGFGIPVTRNITEYKWLGKGQGLPLLQINEENLTTTVVYRDNIYGTGFRELKKNDLKIFPNPASGRCTVQMDGFHSPATIEMYDITGSSIMQKNLDNFPSISTQIDLTGLEPGYYTIRVTSAEAIFTGRVFVQ
jgi:hypothetical protein